MSYFAVFYTYSDDLDAVAEIRPHHRKFLASLRDTGHLVGSGPMQDSLTPNALIILRYPDGTDAQDVEKVLDQDPYTLNGLLAKRTVRPWQVPLNIWE